MAIPIEQVASHWIVLTRAKGRASDEEHERGSVLYDLARAEPERAWEIIIQVVSRYEEADLFSEGETDAKHIVCNTAAGPLEDLLAKHGHVFIERVEAIARQDRRFFWALGCVWQNSMTDEIWSRVQRAAGAISR
ncbi:MAG: DUF6869 domain-containing protein [Pseudomonadota bacterium]